VGPKTNKDKPGRMSGITIQLELSRRVKNDKEKLVIVDATKYPT